MTTFAEMQKALEQAGVVGAGGAGFPTHRKMANGIDTILVNAVECEPLLHTDTCLLRHFQAEIVAGAESFAAAMGAREVVIGVKKHNAEALGLADKQALGPHTRVAVVPNVYPMGDEIVLLYEALGRRVAPGALPSSVGVVVVNAETALNINNAIAGKPVTHSWLTLAGNIAAPRVLCVPVGTPVKDLLEACGVAVPAGHVLLDGGPAMGSIIDPATATVGKTTKGLLVLPDTIAAVTAKRVNPGQVAKRSSSSCCQCSICTDMCPRHLLGWPLQPHKTVRAAGMRQVGELNGVLSASLCCGCGVCSFVACTQGCAPTTVMDSVKRGLAANGLRYSGDGRAPDSMRPYRMVPSRRFAALLGVRRFDKPAEWDKGFTMQPAAHNQTIQG